MFEAQCRCGAVGLRIAGKAVVQLYCHCDDCQSAHCASYTSAAVYPAGAVQVIRGTPAPIMVKTTSRMRCPDCGTYLFAELSGVRMRSVSAYLLPDGAFKPQFHVQCAHAVLPVMDDLPHFKGFPPAFGGSDERVDW